MGAAARPRAFFSWSGGKDSMLALHRALEAGVRVEALLSMFDESGQRSRSHALPPALMQATRLAVSGSSASPGLFEMLALLGRDTVVERLRRAADHVADAKA